MINLLENALKFSFSRKEVWVSLDEDERGNISLRVSNLGVGIPKKDWTRVFQPYYRSEVDDARGPRLGTGIGLALVDEHVQGGHGGSVRLSSTLKNKQTGMHRTVVTIQLTRKTLEAKMKEWSNANVG